MVKVLCCRSSKILALRISILVPEHTRKIGGGCHELTILKDWTSFHQLLVLKTTKDSTLSINFDVEPVDTQTEFVFPNITSNIDLQ